MTRIKLLHARQLPSDRVRQEGDDIVFSAISGKLCAQMKQRILENRLIHNSSAA